MPTNRKVEIYAGRRGLLKRKQWFARVVASNGKNVWRTSEGYNNLREVQDEVGLSFPGLVQHIIDPVATVKR
jgi:hypothetical protein